MNVRSTVEVAAWIGLLTLASACIGGGGGGGSANPCQAVCNCVGDEAGSEGKQACMSDCTSIGTPAECRSTLAENGVFSCDSQCEGFSTTPDYSGGDSPGSGGNSGGSSGGGARCADVCQCVGAEAGSEAGGECLDGCEEDLNQSACESTLAQNGIVSCDYTCAAFGP